MLIEDRIAFRVDDGGKVSLARDEAPEEPSAVDAFLAFLSNDIKRRPQAVRPMPDEAVQRMRADRWRGGRSGRRFRERPPSSA